MNKKAQVKMFENVGVMVVFFFLIVIGAIMYTRYQNVAFEAELNALLDANAFQISQKTFHLPELDCLFGGVRIQGCIDKIKLEKFVEKLKEPSFKTKYYETFGYSEVTLKQILPSEEFTIVYNLTPPKFSQKIKRFTPILVFDVNKEGACASLTGQCAFATLEVNYYAQ